MLHGKNVNKKEIISTLLVGFFSIQSCNVFHAMERENVQAQVLSVKESEQQWVKQALLELRDLLHQCWNRRLWFVPQIGTKWVP